MTQTFGRTNAVVPDLWFGILPDCNHEAVFAEIAQEPAVLDVSGGAGRFGHLVSSSEVAICTFGGRELVHANSARHAADLIGAHIVETLSGVGRPSVDFYCLRISSALSEDVINGALAALDDAKNDGAIKYLGIYAHGDWPTVLRVWQFHDAFEFAMADNNPRRRDDFESVAGFAASRRVGIASCHCLNWGDGQTFFTHQPDGWTTQGAPAIRFALASGPVLVGVRSEQEVRNCRAARHGDPVDPRTLADTQP